MTDLSATHTHSYLSSCLIMQLNVIYTCMQTDQIIVRVHINTFNNPVFSVRVTADIFTVVTKTQRLYKSIHTKSM